MEKINIKGSELFGQEKGAANDRDTKKRLVEVVFILDRSGSMSGMEADTIGGFNAMLDKQLKEGNNIIWSTVLFDHVTEVVHDRVPIEKVQPLNSDTYYVRGSTALLDAVGGSIHHIGNVHKYARREDRPDKTLFVITTDGMENSSVVYNYRDVRKMIEKEQSKYGWEFIFLGANMDAVAAASRIGIRESRSARFHNDSKGIATNFAVVGEAMTSLYREDCIEEACLAPVREDYRKRK